VAVEQQREEAERGFPVKTEASSAAPVARNPNVKCRRGAPRVRADVASSGSTQGHALRFSVTRSLPFQLIQRSLDSVLMQHSVIGHSVIWSFSHSVTRSFGHHRHAVIRSFGHSVIRSFGHSVIRLLGYAVTRSFNLHRHDGHSVIRSFGHSVTRILGHSITIVTRLFGHAVMRFLGYAVTR
jgi:hypothetical protein